MYGGGGVLANPTPLCIARLLKIAPAGLLGTTNVLLSTQEGLLMQLMFGHDGLDKWALAEKPLLIREFSEWRKLFETAPKKIDLPVTLYRGSDTYGWCKSMDAGAAWTRDLEVAKFFAKWSTGQGREVYPETEPQLLSLEVDDPAMILAVYPTFIEDRTQAGRLIVERDLGEIILDPDLIDVYKVTRLTIDS